MEFENTSADKSTEISEAQRLSASSKKLELVPLHTDVAPEALPSGTASDTFGSPIPPATISTESEDTSAYQNKSTPATPATTPQKSPSTAIVIIFAALAIAAIIGYILITR
jgi:hypothetical protein